MSSTTRSARNAQSRHKPYTLSLGPSKQPSRA